MVKVSGVREVYEKVLGEVSKVLVGKSSILELSFIAVLTDGHILLEGVPGVAKTLMAKAFSKSLGISFRRIQLTPDVMPSDITGTFIFNPKERTFEFKEGPIFTNALLVDEINRATPKTQSALLEGMQEKQVTVEGYTKSLPSPFMIIATQNPIELQGTYPLPEAQLDRFMFRAIVEYPSHMEEVQILQKAHEGLYVEQVQTSVSHNKLNEAKEAVSRVFVSGELMDYIVSLVESIREDKESVILGGSPRASVHLLNCSKCLAALSGRDYIIPDDVKHLAFHTLNHRVLLNPAYSIKFNNINAPFNYEGLKAVVQKALAKVEPPR